MASLFGDLRGRALLVVAGCLACQMGLGFGYAWGAIAPEMLADLGWSRAAFSSARAPQLWVMPAVAKRAMSPWKAAPDGSGWWPRGRSA